MSRHFARETAMRMLYSWSMGDEELQTTLSGLCLDDQVREGNTLSAQDETYVSDTVAGVQAHVEELDRQIARYAKGWALERLPKVELAILRLGAYELYFREDIPTGVTINECVDMVKRFSQIKSSSYVNGILSSCAKSGLEQAEEETAVLEDKPVEASPTEGEPEPMGEAQPDEPAPSTSPEQEACTAPCPEA